MLLIKLAHSFFALLSNTKKTRFTSLLEIHVCLVEIVTKGDLRCNRENVLREIFSYLHTVVQ